MKRDELDRLLARYHMGDLSAMERKRLFDAAMEHQDVFDELMGEDGLRDALADPVLREMALEELNEVPERGVASLMPMSASMRAPEPVRGPELEPEPADRAGWRKRWVWPAVATAAAACVAVGAFLWQRTDKPAPVEVAVVTRAPESPAERSVPARTDAEAAPKPLPSERPRAGKRFEAPASPVTGEKAVVSAPEVEVAVNLPKAKTDAAVGAAPSTAAPTPQVASAAARVALSELKDARQATGATVVLSMLDAEGRWQRLEGTVPRGARLKATVTSDRDAIAMLEPAHGRPVAVRAGVPSDIELPTAETGERVFAVILRDGTLGRMDEGRAVAMRAMESDQAKREEGARSKERANEVTAQKSTAAKKAAPPLSIRYRVQ